MYIATSLEARKAGFLVSHKLEQFEFKLQKILGFRNIPEKLQKYIILGKKYKATKRAICMQSYYLT